MLLYIVFLKLQIMQLLKVKHTLLSFENIVYTNLANN